MVLGQQHLGPLDVELGVPGIYRSQASLAPGVKVRRCRGRSRTQASAWSYAWSTSPLRRYTDLVNQWQTIACARHGQTVTLVAPLSQRSVSGFLQQL